MFGCARWDLTEGWVTLLCTSWKGGTAGYSGTKWWRNGSECKARCHSTCIAISVEATSSTTSSLICDSTFFARSFLWSWRPSDMVMRNFSRPTQVMPSLALQFFRAGTKDQTNSCFESCMTVSASPTRCTHMQGCWASYWFLIEQKIWVRVW